MINKEKIRLMTQAAAYESSSLRRDSFAKRYYKKDYVGLEKLKSKIWFTVFYAVYLVYFAVDEFYSQFPAYKGSIYIGGPVNIESLYYLHCLGSLVPDSLKISDNLYWGGDFETLKNLINSKQVDSNSVRFFLGYSGWDKNQLKEELDEDSWLVGDIQKDTIFAEPKKLWEEMVMKIGGKYQLWQNYPENPSMN